MVVDSRLSVMSLPQSDQDVFRRVLLEQGIIDEVIAEHLDARYKGYSAYETDDI